MRGTGSWIAADPFSQNETYLGQRLLFQRAGSVETALMDVVSGEKAKKILRRAFLGAILIAILGTVTALLGGGLALLGGLIGGLGPFVWLAVQLFVPRTEILSDWNLILDGKCDVADSAYASVFQALRDDHAIPAAIEPRRLRVGPPVRGVRNMLRVRIGKYYTLVSVFAFGNDLYLGWTLLRRQVPVMLVLRWLASVFARDPGYSGLIDLEPIKAMRETVHNALRRAIEAAVIGRSTTIVEAFGHDLPIEMPTHPNGAGYPEEPPPIPPQRQQAAPARRLTVVARTPVYAADGSTPMGHVEPGFSCELLGDDAVGLVVRDTTGTVAVLKDRSSVRWA